MKKNTRLLTTKLIAYTALMTALTYVGTLLGFSGGQFYFNLGDTVILICAYLLGPIPAMLAGGLGAFFGDLTVYPATMVYTLVIKGIEGLAAGLLFLLLKKACAKYLAKHMTAEMKDYMASHPARDVDQEADEAVPITADADKAQAVGTAEASRSDENSEAAQALQEASADVAYAALQGENKGSSDADSPSPSQTHEIAQNDVDMQKTSEKTSIYAKIKKVKMRVLALTYGITFPICLFCTSLMMVGYFISQAFIYGTYAAALVALPMDAVQATVSSVAATEIIALLSSRTK